MKILILNPPDENKLPEYPDENGNEYIESDDFGHFPPLGPLYVMTYLEENSEGHDLFFKDCVAEHISHENLKDYIQSVQPDVVGITSFTISLIDVIYTARTVREIMPKAHITLGGHHPINFPFEAVQLKEFNSIVVGEGEIAFTELVAALEKGEDVATVHGVYTKDSVHNEKDFKAKPDKRFLNKLTLPPAYVDDINSLPMPNRNYISHINYQSIVGATSKLATVLASRGCPYRCTFCEVPFKVHRERDAKSVIDEVEVCLNMGYEEIHFYDDLFNIRPQRVIEICDEIDQRDLRFHWDFRGRVNGVDYESLRRFKQSGGRMISFGIESTNDETLRVLRKGSRSEMNKNALKWCRELGITTIADFMIGLPTERSKEDIRASVNKLIEYDPDYALFSVLSLYPNTEVYDQAVERGFIKDADRWKKWSLNPTMDFQIDRWNEFLSTPELIDLQRASFKKFYLRPKKILRSLFETRSITEFKKKTTGMLKVIGVGA